MHHVTRIVEYDFPERAEC